MSGAVRGLSPTCRRRRAAAAITTCQSVGDVPLLNAVSLNFASARAAASAACAEAAMSVLRAVQAFVAAILGRDVRSASILAQRPQGTSLACRVLILLLEPRR